LSLPESIEDTVRVLSGYADALVVRAGRPAARLDAAIRADTPWLNGGDEAEHPSQALIDIFAMERLVAPVADLHVAITGDLRMRAGRSLLRLLTRSRPARLTVVSDPELGLSDPVVTSSGATLLDSVAELGDVDVLYAVGIPKGPGEAVRSRLRVGAPALQALSPRGVVLSPLPLIDEIALSVRDDPRMRFFEQSDLGLFVRMALLEELLGVG
jgi:aspartate carbamoyltransferase catalytic subunit